MGIVAFGMEHLVLIELAQMLQMHIQHIRFAKCIQLNAQLIQQELDVLIIFVKIHSLQVIVYKIVTAHFVSIKADVMKNNVPEHHQA